MSTWETIYGIEEPVRGKVSEFVTARSTFIRWESDAQTILDEFFGNCGFSDRLNREPGDLLSEFLAEADEGLHDLPRIAETAHETLDRHLDGLRDLRSEANEALARARTAWNDKNELEPQVASLESQVASLERQIGNADDDDDTSGLETSLSGASSQLSSLRGQLDEAIGTLDDVRNNDYPELRTAEETLNGDTASELTSIDLGKLKDPGAWDKFVGAVSGFVGGFIESVANMVEAFFTGDWATFWHELRNVLNAVLLVLGTIALFTGVGTILGVILLGGALLNTAVTAGLYFTQTPNPQTGETIGLGDVVLAAVGSAFALGGIARTFRTMTMVNRGQIPHSAAGLGRHMTLWGQFQRLQFPIGLRNGGIVSMFKGLGPGIQNGANRFLNNTFWRSNPVAHVDPTKAGFLPTMWNVRGTVGAVQDFTDISLGWGDNLTGAKGWDAYGTAAGNYTGFNQFNSPNWSAFGIPGTPFQGSDHGSADVQGTPMFSDRPSPQQIDLVLNQAAQSPNVHVVPAN